MSHQQNLEHEVLQVFAALVFGDMSLATFQQWVFATPDIADVIGYDQYFLLLDVEYRLPSATENVVCLVTTLAEQAWPGQLLREHIRSILCGLIDGSLHIVSACEQLAWWHSHGAPWIPRIFVGLDSELDAAPDPERYHLWNPDALVANLAEGEQWVAHYYALAHAEAQKLLTSYLKLSGRAVRSIP